jgi:SNF2 family DNA or RNA helicase
VGAGRVTGYTGLKRIGRTLAPIMVRRRKSEVLRHLPSRTDQNLLVPMTGAQMAVHQENADVVAKIVQRWRRRAIHRCPRDSRQRRWLAAYRHRARSVDRHPQSQDAVAGAGDGAAAGRCIHRNRRELAPGHIGNHAAARNLAQPS